MLAIVLAAGGYLAYKIVEDPGNQLFGRTLVAGPSNAREVALTFDDGPNPPYTNRILDVLKAEHVHATFFVVGRAADAYPDVVRRIVREGNALGNHTWDHSHLLLQSRAAMRNELRRTDATIYRIAGVHTRLMRPPFGARDFAVLDEAKKLGYTVVMWSVPLPKDWEQPGDAAISKRVIENVHDGGIVVLHDGNRGIVCRKRPIADADCDRGQDVAATRTIVERLRAQGYRFVTIPQLLANMPRQVVKHTAARPSR